MSYSTPLDDLRNEYRRLKPLAEKALSQISDAQFFRSLGPESNSPAILVKHLAGNMRSRWRNFMTTDGEKADRYRDTEFVIGDEDTREALMERWQEAWDLTLLELDGLTDAQLPNTVTIRGEPFTVSRAIARQLSHCAYRVGQIVHLAMYFAGDDWKTLSIPRGASEAFNRAPALYQVEGEHPAPPSN